MDNREIPIDVVRQQLDLILASQEFDASERNRRFLQFVVEEALEGRADRIKAYTVATVVFGRNAGFDPQLDSIVRIEAGRLRRSLERYYLTAGANDPIRIEIPKGTYVPTFAMLHAGGRPESRKRTEQVTRNVPSIIVEAFDEESDPPANPLFVRGFTRDLIVGLMRFKNMKVFSAEAMPPSSPNGHSGNDASGKPISDEHDSYRLSGSIRHGNGHLIIEALLVDSRDGRLLWADRYERQYVAGDAITTRDEIAVNVVRSIAQAHGAIFQARVSEVEGKPPEFMTSYEAVIQFHHYTKTYDVGLFEPAFAALSAAVRKDPHYADAHACLSQLHTDSHRFGYRLPENTPEPLQIARTLALHAVEQAPDSSRGYHALGLALWFLGELEPSIDALETGLEFNPNDPDLKAETGLRYALLAKWNRALPLLEDAYNRDPFQPGGYRVGLALYHYAHGRFEEALLEARRATLPYVLYGNLLVAASAAELGLMDEAGAAIRQILKINPSYAKLMFEDLLSRHMSMAVVDGLVASMTKAGLPVDRPPSAGGAAVLRLSDRRRAV
jgi:adenylate cyclase